MAEPLENLARRLADDPFFLACPLALFAQSENMNDTQLAQHLGCSAETLVKLRLCRAPKGEPKQFQDDVHRIAQKFGLQAAALAIAVRHGQAILAMQRKAGAATLLAARDGDRPTDSEGAKP
ncbi:MAG TPA: hypothetical protein VFE62_23290 [Gemmataceae bacterium]|nr:hypothetical protein [Gemmataceae bacterium]